MPGKRLVVTLSEAEHSHGRGRGQHIADRLIALFKHHGLPGAIAYRTVAGYTGEEPIRTANIVDLAAPLPIRVEVVDTAEVIERVLPDVYDLVEYGLVEVQDTQIVKWWAGVPAAPRGRSEVLVRTTGRARSLQIQIAEADRWLGEPLYEAIVKRARQLGIAGASVYRGILGYGAHHQVHHHHVVRHDDPILISIIDNADLIDELVAAIDGMVSDGCLLVLADVEVIQYAPRVSCDPDPVSPVPVPLDSVLLENTSEPDPTGRP